MADEPKTPDQKSYEGWTESEKAVDYFFELAKELNETFKNAAEAQGNPTWFLNGRAADILVDLERKREILSVLKRNVTEGEVPKLIDDCIKRADEYIDFIKKQFNDPAVKRRIAAVKDRIRRTWN